MLGPGQQVKQEEGSKVVFLFLGFLGHFCHGGVAFAAGVLFLSRDRLLRRVGPCTGK